MSPQYVIISGGTGANSIASAFGPNPAFVLPVSDDGGSSSEILRCFGGPSIGDIRSRLNRLIPLPVQTPGSALTELSPEDEELIAIHELLAYRFPSDAGEKHVREIWGEIVEGRSSLWDGIGEDKKECIRAFLVHFQTLALRRAHKRFSFRNFSLGNGFLTGARDMFGSLPSAIFLFKSLASVPAGAAVIPAINTNQTVTIAVELENGETIVGQCAISHPTDPPASVLAGTGQGVEVESPKGEALELSQEVAGEGPTAGAGPAGGDALRRQGPYLKDGSNGAPVGRIGRTSSMRLRTHFRRDSRTFDTTPMDSPVESTRTSLDGSRPRESLFSSTSPTIPGHPTFASTSRDRHTSKHRPEKEKSEVWGGANLGYTKGEEEVPLEARISRLFYINLYGQEIFPSPNADYVSALSKRDVLVYSCGSLWTSIIPCLTLRGLASAIATSPTLRARIVLLNSHNDRETPDFTASDYIKTICAMLGHYDRPRRIDPGARRGSDGTGMAYPAPLQAGQWEARRLVSHVVYLEGAEVAIDEDYFKTQGIQLFCIPESIHQQSGSGTVRLFTPEAVEWALGQIVDP